MYEMESVEKEGVVNYTEKMLETLEDDICIRVTELDEGEENYGVNSLYEGAEEKELEFQSEETGSIGNYLEERIKYDREGLDLEISSEDEKYTVSSILEG